MKNKILIFFTILLLFTVLTVNVNAFMPRITHKLIQTQVTANVIDSQLYRDCMAYPRLCYSGNVLTDISVLYYYTDSQKYVATHSSSFFRQLYINAKTPQEKACAVGNGLHQSSDIESHNNMVPYAITNSYLVNDIIHVFAEQKVDTMMDSEYPQIRNMSISDLSDYDQCKDLFIRTMQGDSAYCQDNGACMSKDELDTLYGQFISELINSDTGYDTAFKNKSFFVDVSSIPLVILISYYVIMLSFLLISLLLIFKIIKRNATLRHWIALVIFLPLFGLLAFFLLNLYMGTAFNTFINFISPISQLVPVGDVDGHILNAINNGKSFLQGEIWLNGKDASGFTQLAIADASIQNLDYIILGLILVLLVIYLFFLFKKNKVVTRSGFSL
jgi:hypothetical protein